MAGISIQEAKNQLQQLIELASKGEEVILTKSGKPLARILPYKPTRIERKSGQ